jgi:Short C-terminal domain
MASQPGASRLHERSLIGVSASIGAAMVLGYITNAIGAPPAVQGTVAAAAVGIPAATEYSLQSKRRDPAEDAELIRQGELRRPIPLIVAMSTAVLLLVDVMAFVLTVWLFATLVPEPTSVAVLWMFVTQVLIVLSAEFFVASYVSHYLGKRPLLWIAITVGVVVVIEALLLLAGLVVAVTQEREWLMYGPAHVTREELNGGWALLGVLRVIFVIALFHLLLLGVCLAGVWYGRRFRYAKFLKRKLTRVERRAEQADTTREQPSLTANDAFEQLKKLANLRDAGVLTEEEFQAKKTEILSRI